jgi:hypothetical protein
LEHFSRHIFPTVITIDAMIVSKRRIVPGLIQVDPTQPVDDKIFHAIEFIKGHG